MRDKIVLKMTYLSFSKSHPSTFTVKPYCVKVYRQRWYMLAKTEVSELRMYSLDRIVELKPTDKHYRLPANFDAETYFAHLVGVSDVKNQPEEVIVRVNKQQANYLRTLPIHDSQQEKERTKEYSIFRYFVVPNFEFVQELRAQGSALQVLELHWLAGKMRKESEKVTALYK
jgi:predicted DNA-binding transcriptional regulator YafY